MGCDGWLPRPQNQKLCRLGKSLMEQGPPKPEGGAVPQSPGSFGRAPQCLLSTARLQLGEEDSLLGGGCHQGTLPVPKR